MEKDNYVTGCDFYKVCSNFGKKNNCTKERIREGKCKKPKIPGIKIRLVRPILAKDYLIAIISICPNCRKVRGVVSGDREYIYYSRNYVKLSEADLAKVPEKMCETCKKKCAFTKYCHYKIPGHYCTAKESETCEETKKRREFSTSPCPIKDLRALCKDPNFRAVIPQGKACHVNGKCLSAFLEEGIYKNVLEGKKPYEALYYPVRQILRESQRSTGV